MKRQLATFLLRLLVNALGIWIAVRIFGGTHVEDTASGVGAFLLAALIFSIVNAILKPIVIILSLPAILLTLGLFTIIVNGLMVYLSLKLAPGFNMSFGYSILTGLLLSLVNYIVSNVLELSYEKK